MNSSKGFSLVELLASLAIFLILGLAMMQVTSAVNRATNLSNRAIDASSQSRLAFDRIGLDLAAMIRRKDIDFSAQSLSSGTGATMLFASAVTSAGLSSSNRGISFIAYAVAPHPDNQNRSCLLRAGRAIGSGSSGFFGLQANGLPVPLTATSVTPFLPTGADFDILAPGAIRMVVAFQLYPDNQPVTLLSGSTLTKAQGQLVYSPPIRTLTPLSGGAAVDYLDLSRVSSIVIGLVTIDLKTLQLLNATQVSDLAKSFPIPADNLLPVAAWSGTASNAAALPSSIPLPARQAVRIFERSFPITSFPASGL